MRVDPNKELYAYADIIVSNFNKSIETFSDIANNDTEKSAFTTVYNYSIINPLNGDLTDIYYLHFSDSGTNDRKLPFALLLQGANVDKSFYKEFAKTVASYGFVAVVPNHKSTVLTENGLYAEEEDVNEILEFMKLENASTFSLLNEKIDTRTMVLIGHSYGGAASLYAIQGTCQFPFCIGFNFHRPEALTCGAFYGTILKGPIGGVPELNNYKMPIALVQGSLDGMATPAEGRETFLNVKDSPKTYIVIEGANHYGITDINNPPGAKPDKNNPTIAQKESAETIGKLCALFLRTYVLGDDGARTYIQNKGDLVVS
ncbi:MAG: hypothetical protein MUO26_09710 [Methanotrichaceae archaeon]|nr:hypothetical protein [Methanotrichaceae archaeon]